MRRKGKNRKYTNSKLRRRKRYCLILFALVVLTVCLIVGYFIFRKETVNNKTEVESKDINDVSEKVELEINLPQEELEPELSEKGKLELEIDEILDAMSLEDKISQLFFVTPEVLIGSDSVVVRAEQSMQEALQNEPVGGLILFSNNIQNEEQLCNLLSDIRSYSKYPIFLGVDEEGGPLVARVANSGTIPVPVFPNMQEIGNTGQPEKAYEVGITIGSYLKRLGFNVDFAPVADVVTTSQNTVIGERSFGSDPNLVSQMVENVVKGFQEQGISATLKHFPGHGSTVEDSHTETAVLNKTVEELENTDLLPFKAGIYAGADMVMVGHISVPSVTGNNIPASLSQEIIIGILRTKLGFDGIVITDSMNMGAIVNYYGLADAAVMVIQAGGDMILLQDGFQEARQAVFDAVKNQVITEERIDESLRRIYRVKLKNNL